MTGTGSGLPTHASRRWHIGCVPLSVLLAVGAFSYGGRISAAASEPAWTAYVGDSDNTVTPIDVGAYNTGSAIPVGHSPAEIAITPDGKTAYVVNEMSDTVTPITTEWNLSGVPIPVGSGPFGIAVTPSGKTAYVTNALSNTVTPINVSTNTTGTSIPVGNGPSGIAITPDGKTAYVADEGADTVTPINLATGVAGAAITVGLNPLAIAVAPDGTAVYVTNYQSNSVTKIDTATNAVGAAIPVGNHPSSIAITPDGTTAYVVNSADSSVTPIDLTTNTAGSAIAESAGAITVAVSPDGQTAYVTNSTGNSMTPMDTTTNVPGGPIAAGNGPGDIVITPDQAPVAALTVHVSGLGFPTTLDASASTVAYGSIASFAWDFGDGGTATTTTPTITHAYATVGTYTATVTETSTAGTSLTSVFTGQTMSRDGGPQARASQVISIVAPGAYTPLSPFRICDTRPALPSNQCAGRTLGANTSIGVQVTGTPGPLGQSVPTNALAVVLNVTALSESSANGYVSVYPYGEARPNISNVSVDAGATQANLVVVRLGAQGKTTVFSAAGKTDVVVDVEGYFAPPDGASLAGEYHSMPPLRICDTRGGKGTECAGTFDHPLAANTWRDVVLSGLPSGANSTTPSIPLHGAAAAVFDLTATQGTQSTYLAVAPPNMTTDACPTTAPTASNLNPRAGVALPNRVISRIGPHQDVCVFNAVGSIDFIIDVNGWFGDGTEGTTSPRGAFFYAIPPVRVCDTRTTSQGSLAYCQSGTLGSNQAIAIKIDGKSLIPAAGGSNPPIAVVANLTGVAGTATTYFTLFPVDAAQPLASDLNPRAGDVVANLAFVGIATTGSGTGNVFLYNAAGSINAILDIAGWFQ